MSLAKFLIAAERFATQYYEALNRHRPLLPFYTNSTSRYTTQADISINGAKVEAPADYYNLLQEQGSDVRYEIESLDAHVLNPSFQLDAPTNVYDNEKHESKGNRMSIAVTVMGRVQFGKGKEAPLKMFNETFVLVPNWDALQKNPPRGINRWLIMSQNFRAL